MRLSLFNFLEMHLKSTETLEERFQRRVGKKLPTGCMEWQSYRQPNGYGRFSFGKRKRALAHRFAYSLAHGEIPQGKVVMHSCDNPRCVNVEHLHLGTQAENVADMVTKGRFSRSKLEPHLKAILKKRAAGYTQQQIADEYRVSRPLVSMFLSGSLLSNRSM